MRHPDDQHESSLPASPGRTIVIAGLHRSGTTLLHRLLAGTGSVETVRFLDVVEFPRLVDLHRRGEQEAAIDSWTTRMASWGPTRGIDAIPIGPLEPEEYAGVLRRSVVGIDNRRPHGNEDLRSLVLLARKKRLLAADDRPLVLKSPIDCYDGLSRIEAALPGAFFIFVHRHPGRMVPSSMATWHRLLSARQPWFAALDRDYRRLFEIPGLIDQARARCGTEAHAMRLRDRYRTGTDHLVEFARHLPPERRCVIRLEDLRRSPVEVFGGVLEALGRHLGLTSDLPSLEHVVPAGETRSLPIVDRVFDESIESWRPYLRHLGYADRPED